MLVDPKPPPEGTETYKGLPAIRNWKPIHDQVLMMHLAGYQNQVIAERLDLSKPRISQILHDPRAEKAIAKVRRRLARKAKENIEERLVFLAEKGLGRIAETVDETFKAGTKAKKHQDHVGFKLLEAAGFGKGSSPDDRSKGVQLSREAEDRLVSAMEKSAEATKRHGRVIDARSEVVDNDDTEPEGDSDSD